MPKGEKIRPKQEMDQLPLENFRVRVFVCQNTLVCLLLSRVGLLWGEYSCLSLIVKSWPLVGRILLFVSYCQELASCGKGVDYGKKGEFSKSLINFSWNNSLYVSTSVFDLEIAN
jgi:hypothetical protein